ncbi:lytic murein transglycosylase B [Planctobacterium marinum]|uniref:lytic murein transglycosylase B n=1 Tax=Planctobacterium marinum TaxID=1631968 RepID=UPI001E5D173B|nr:lytic murein transglycosylase B [Planctobacterium marinum]MCC2605630.1 lytic murein transglycosylase B [Planctobacterium marinum]
MCALKKSIRQLKLALFGCVSLTAATLSYAAPQESNDPVATEQEVEQFISDTIEEYGLDGKFVRDTVNAASINSKVLEAIARPWEAKPWYQYYPIFLTEKRLERGLAFWQKHRKTLARAEAELGVPAHIIVAIIGVETFYGSYTGTYSVLDALYSLGFHYPPRAAFFKKELGQYLKLVSEEGWDPLAARGSYAGAMGWGQFISSSYRHYAIDFDGDSQRDLLNNPVDAIGSVANYFKQHKWQTGEAVAFKASIGNEQALELVESDLSINHSWKELSEAGVLLQDTIQPSPDTPAKLLALELEEGKEYWVVLDNFYVITRYNHSPLYAMVVFKLSEQLRAAMQRQ